MPEGGGGGGTMLHEDLQKAQAALQETTTKCDDLRAELAERAQQLDKEAAVLNARAEELRSISAVVPTSPAAGPMRLGAVDGTDS